MKVSKPFFGTGLSRSGGALYCNMLSVHPSLMVACCPYLGLYRSFRNAIVRAAGEAAISAVPGHAPMQDYYFDDGRLRVFDAILDANLDLPFDKREWEEFLSTTIQRGALEAADLTHLFERLRGETYQEMFRNALAIVGTGRSSLDRNWVGFHETWIIDFYPALARAFDEARFLVMLRDPRAIINSMRAIVRTHPDQVAQVLSYVRHWRKYVSLALMFRNDPLFSGRIHVSSHDSVLMDPHRTVGSICRFLDLSFDEAMLDSRNFYDYATQETWIGNSSFEDRTEGVRAHRSTRWRSTLDPVILDTVEWLCGPDMRLAGYEPITRFAEAVEPSAAIIDFLRRESASELNWRSDLGDPDMDIGYEIERKRLLILSSPLTDAAMVRRCFLFPEVYAALRDPVARRTVLSRA